MDYVKSFFVAPDPNEQFRKISLSLRSQIRSLDRTLQSTRQAEAKAKLLIHQAEKRATRDPARAAQAHSEMRSMASEVIRIRRSAVRTMTIKAQVNSTLLKVQEVQAMRKVTNGMQVGARVMRQMAVLSRLPETRVEAMRFIAELEKSGVGQEMADEIMDDMFEEELGEEEEEGAIGEGEVDQVLTEVLKGTKGTEAAGTTTTDMLPAAPVKAVEEEEEEEEDVEASAAMMNQMRDRLEALRG